MPSNATKACSTTLPCCTIAGNDNQRLELCVPVLVRCLVGESTSGARQSCVRGLPASVLSSEFYAVQVLARPQNLSILWNREVSLIRRSSKYTFLWPTVQDPSITEVSLIQRAIIERFHCTACTNVSLILRFSMSTLFLNSWQELGGMRLYECYWRWVILDTA